MFRQLFQAAGYGVILVLPVLLALGTLTGHVWLAFITLFGVIPLLRVLAGDVQREPVIWREGLSIALHALPAIYAVALIFSVTTCAWVLRRHAPLELAQLTGFFASLWATLLTATVPAHELIHRRDPWGRRLGRWVAGIAGYPLLPLEHMGHHSSAMTRAEWPWVRENVYRYAIRQIRTSACNVLEHDSLRRAANNQTLLRGELAQAVMVTLLTGLGFTWAAGWRGAALYATSIALMFFSVQLIAYIQHWGLGEKSSDPNGLEPSGWEDGCRIQAWLTLNLAFHDAHHRSPHLPYYRLTLSEHAPRLPAGYVIMMVAALLPPVWRRLMLPAFQHWQRRPAVPLTAGRRLMCIKLPDLGRSQPETGQPGLSPHDPVAAHRWNQG